MTKFASNHKFKKKMDRIFKVPDTSESHKKSTGRVLVILISLNLLIRILRFNGGRHRYTDIQSFLKMAKSHGGTHLCLLLVK